MATPSKVAFKLWIQLSTIVMINNDQETIVSMRRSFFKFIQFFPY